MATGKSGSGSQTSYASLAADSSIVDGNSATGIDITGAANSTTSVTAATDMGSAVAVTQVATEIGYETGVPSMILEYSLNSTSWTPLSLLSPSGHGGTFSLVTVTKTTSVTARYFRFSLTDASGMGVASRASIREITVTTANVNYNEVVQVMSGVKGTDVDLAAYSDVGTAKAGVKPSGIDSFGHGGGGSDFVENTTVMKAGSKPSGVDSSTMIDVGTAPAFSIPAGTDVQGNSSIPTSYHEAPIMLAGVKPSGVSTSAMNDLPQAGAGLKASGSDASTMADVGTVKSGVKPSGTSANGYIESGQVKAGVKPSGVDKLLSRDTVTVKAGPKPSGVDVQAYFEFGTGKLGSKPSGVDTSAMADAGTAKAGLSVALSLGVVASLNTGTVKSGVKVSGIENMAVRDRATLLSGVKPLVSTGEPRNFGEVGMVRSGGRVSGVDNSVMGE